jgi:hypothetical protein
MMPVCSWYLRQATSTKADEISRAKQRLPVRSAAMIEVPEPEKGSKTLAWVQQPEADPSSSVWMRRMGAVRGFARHMSGIDPANEIPPLGLVTFRRRWRQPFIYADADIVALMEEVPTSSPRLSGRPLIGR